MTQLQNTVNVNGWCTRCTAAAIKYNKVQNIQRNKVSHNLLDEAVMG